MATILPSANAATRSQTVVRLARSWVTMNTVSPRVFCKVLIRASKSPAAIGSRPEVGSSRNQDRRIEREGARQRHALGHAARQLGWIFVGVLRPQSNHLELGDRDLVHQLLRQDEVLSQRKLDVLPDRQRGEQRALLEQDAPFAGRALRAAILRTADRLSHDFDGAASSRDEADDGAHQADLPPPEAPTRPRISPRRTSSER
jgi:hypothetical protein